MKLKILGSSSSGNCYILQGKHETLILECGLSQRQILKALDFSVSNVVGVLISHEHKDHCKSVKELMANGIDVYASKGTIEAMAVEGHRVNAIEPRKQFSLGGYTILPFETQHDCKEPLGFLVEHEEMGKMIFATDTYYVRYKFQDLNHILIECNYSDEILEQNIKDGKIPASLRNRILKSHFSLSNVKEFLKSNDLGTVRNIVLLHLSDGNSNSKEFRQEIEGLTGKAVYVADKGLEIDVGIDPF